MKTTFNIALLTCLLPLNTISAHTWKTGEQNTEAGIPDPLSAQDGAGTDDEVLLHAWSKGARHSSQPKPTVAPTATEQIPVTFQPENPTKPVKAEKTAAQKKAELKQAQQRVEAAQSELDTTQAAQSKNSRIAKIEAAVAAVLMVGGAVAEIHNKSIEASVVLILAASGCLGDAYRRVFSKNKHLQEEITIQQEELAAAQAARFQAEYRQELHGKRAY